jgi:Tfp pilus assembly protein PilX
MPGTNPLTMIRNKSKAQILLISMVLLSALLGAAILLARSALSERIMADLYLQREKAFYIAEAGIEDAKVTISKQSNWFTDNPHFPEDDINWILNTAKGEIRALGNGQYKMVREGGKNIVYSVGMNKKAKVILKAKIDPATFRASDLKFL